MKTRLRNIWLTALRALTFKLVRLVPGQGLATTMLRGMLRAVLRLTLISALVSALAAPFLGPLAQASSHITASSVVSTLTEMALKKASAAMADAGLGSAPTTAAPASGTVEVAFSPDAGAQALVIKVIDAARASRTPCNVMAYSFTSAPVTDALLRAAKAGVAVRLVADQKHNLADTTGKARAALSALSTAGVDVRLTSAFAIHHDKVIQCGDNVQTGSFNYSASAQTRNSENVIVLWGNRPVAKAYAAHFERNFAGARRYQPNY